MLPLFEKRSTRLMSQWLFASYRKVSTRLIGQLALQLCILAIVLIFGTASGKAQSSVRLPATPNDSAVVNDFEPQGNCVLNAPAGLFCNWYIYDYKTGWSSTPQRGGLSGYSPSGCIVWLPPGCWFQYDFLQFNDGFSVTLPKPAVTDISNGITFELRVGTEGVNDPNVNTAEQNLVSMPGVFRIKTIGKRWGMRTYQKTPHGSGNAQGWDLAPWEPYNYIDNLEEDVYYTFTPDGRVRIDKFTPHQIGTDANSGAPIYNYIWQQSVNDGGWPATWGTDGTQNFFQMQNLVLSGKDDLSGPSGAICSNGSTTCGHLFHSLLVFNTALTNAQMIAQENFYHEAGQYLTTAMYPCNTGRWVNAGVIQTPCGNGGNGNPVPAPDSNARPVYFNATDEYAPEAVSFQQNTDGTLSLGWNPPATQPSLTIIQESPTSPPWSNFYPLSPTGYSLYLLVQTTNGTFTCSIGPGHSAPVPVLGRILEAAIGADYPETSLDGPTDLTAKSWINPTPNNFTPTGPLPNPLPAGWSCNQYN